MKKIDVMGRAKFIRHNNRTILMLDFSGLDTESGHKIIRYAANLIRNMPPRSVYTLTNVTDANFDGDLKEALKDFAAANEPHVVAGAVVGVSGLKQVIFSAITRVSGRKNLKIFSEVGDARDWLTGLTP